MKRSEREITDRAQVDEIIHGCAVCHLAFAAGDEPYAIPVSYGYDGEYLYIHTATRGKKIDLIGINPKVCFTMERNVKLVADSSSPCKWTFSYESVIGYGRIEEMTGTEAQAAGLNEIVKHYSGREWKFEPHELSSTRIWRISVDSITGKRSG